jgi:hypothetical protein
MNPLSSINDEVSTFFRSLGYEVDWDFKRSTGERWYEIIGSDGYMIAQIDMGVPLTAIIEDLTCWHHGKKGTSNVDFKVNAPDGEEFDELLAKVAATTITS